jgi:Putative MetA-pathway of phenol degradation
MCQDDHESTLANSSSCSYGEVEQTFRFAAWAVSSRGHGNTSMTMQFFRWLVLTCAVMTCLFGGSVHSQDLGDLMENSGTDWLRNESPSGVAEGAEEEPLETDRDSFTPSTTVVGIGNTIFESSYSYIENREANESHSFPEILTRYGLTENLELRFGWNYEIGGGGSVSGSGAAGVDEALAGSTQESRILYGLKASLTEQEGWMPQSAVIIQAATPTSGPETATQFSSGYVFGWELPNEWRLDSAMRYAASAEEGDHFNEWAPSVVLKMPVSERITIHGEYFGIFTQNSTDDRAGQYVSPGIHYLITSSCEIGVRVGWGLSEDSAQFFSNIGLGLRF